MGKPTQAGARRFRVKGVRLAGRTLRRAAAGFLRSHRRMRPMSRRRHACKGPTHFRSALLATLRSQRRTHALSAKTSDAKARARMCAGRIWRVDGRKRAKVKESSLPNKKMRIFVAMVDWCRRIVCRKACLSSLCNASLAVVPDASKGTREG